MTKQLNRLIAFTLNAILKYRLVFIMAILTMASINIRSGKSNWKGSVNSDGKGYYAYLPAFLIYHDIHFDFINHSTNPLITGQPNPEFRVMVAGNIVNKYPAGEAVLLLPFFLIAHAITALTGNVEDGYSYFYFVFICIAALFYAWLGLYYTNKLLKNLNFSEGNIFISLLAISFGTQLYVYIVSEPSMSHVFSFGLISGFFYYTYRYFKGLDFIHLYKAAMLMGLIILVRPVNIISLAFVPFLAMSWTNLSKGIRHLLYHFKNAFIIASIITVIASIQVLIWKIQTRNYFVDTYPTEHFIYYKGGGGISYHFYSVTKKDFFSTPLSC